VSFYDVDDPEISKMGLSKDAEVMVVGEMSRLDVKLVENMSGCHAVGPDLFDVGVLELVGPVVVMLVDFSLKMTPVGMDVRIDLNNYVAHIN
jgi:hypothetical protein